MCDIVSGVVAAGPGGGERFLGVAAAVWQQRQTVAAGQSRPGVINQGVSKGVARAGGDP